MLVIITGEPHPWAAHELSFGEASYWAQHDARDDVFYADAAVAGRAASRPVVVVALNGVPPPLPPPPCPWPSAGPAPC